MVDEQDALEMVHLMLEADREQAVEVFLMLLAILVEPAGADMVGPQHLGILVGDRQAAFGVGHFLVRMGQDFGVDEHPRLLDRLSAFFVGLAQVHHQQALGHADLDRGEADAGSVVHRLEHVGDQRAQLVIDLLDR